MDDTKPIADIGKQATNVVASVPPKIAFDDQTTAKPGTTDNGVPTSSTPAAAEAAAPSPEAPNTPSASAPADNEPAGNVNETSPSSPDESKQALEREIGPTTEEGPEKSHPLAPIRIEATPADTKAATNPMLILIVCIGTALAIIGLLVLFITKTLASIGIITVGILIIVGGVLSPKMKIKR